MSWYSIELLNNQLARFDLEILNEDGEVVPIEDLPEGIEITSLVEVDPIITEEQLRQMCFGYMKKEEKDWTCLNNSRVENTNQKKYILYI
jgi:hypothetical protein